jgi:hypothetical protein
MLQRSEQLLRPSLAATFPPVSALQNRVQEKTLEERRNNEEMRHILGIEFLTEKIDRDFHRKASILASAIRDGRATLESDAAAAKLRAAAKWMCRLAARISHKPFSFSEGSPLEAAIEVSFRSALEGLRAADPTLFRRRAEFHHFCTSEAEAVFAAVLAAGSLIEEAIGLVLTFAPGVAEEIYPPTVAMPARIA